MSAENPEIEDPSPASGTRRMLSVLVFVVSLVFFGVHAQRTIGTGDSAEFVIVSATLGIPHPTGYPLYTWLGKLCTLAPLGSIPFRVHFLSALFGALSLAGVFHLVARELERRRVGRIAYLAGFVSVVLLATTPPFWEHSLVAEVYTIKCLFSVLLMYLVIEFVHSDSARTLRQAALVYGLSLGVHMSGLFLLPAILPFTARRLWRAPRLFWSCVGLTALGLSQYLYTYFRAYSGPRYLHAQAHFFSNPAEPGVMHSIGNWFWYVTGGRWREHRAGSLDVVAERAIDLTQTLQGQYGLIVIALAVLGAVLGLLAPSIERRARLRVAVPAAVLAAELVYFGNYLPGSIEMVLPAFAIACIFAGLGVGLVPVALVRLARLAPEAPARRVIAPVVAIALAVAAMSPLRSREFLDRSGQSEAADLITRLARELPEQSLVEGLGWKFDRSAMYYELVEGWELPFRYRSKKPRADFIARGGLFVLEEFRARYEAEGFVVDPFFTLESGLTVYRVVSSD